MVLAVVGPASEVRPIHQLIAVCAALRLPVVIEIVTVRVSGGDEVNHHKSVPVIHTETPALLQGQVPSL